LLRPFLKWAGGKRQLLPALRTWYPPRFSRYFEPFLGSGAVFFDLFAQGRLDGCPATLADGNDDLIGCYRMLRAHVDQVVAELQRLEEGHHRAPSDHYYSVRADGFNGGRRRVTSSGSALADAHTPQLAAMLIYLNRTGFNGLFRLNGDGDFNVPLGRYARPRICDEDGLRAAAAALRQPGVAIVHGPFATSVEEATRGDFVYFDPPYAPLSATSTFTGYTADGFTPADQQQLQRVVLTLAARGCHVVLSNSTAPEIARLYDDNPEAVRVGLKAVKVPARRAINSKPSARGAVLEYVITNVDVQ
jgi:DNA adenine methylase